MTLNNWCKYIMNKIYRIDSYNYSWVVKNSKKLGVKALSTIYRMLGKGSFPLILTLKSLIAKNLIPLRLDLLPPLLHLLLRFKAINLELTNISKKVIIKLIRQLSIRIIARKKGNKPLILTRQELDARMFNGMTLQKKSSLSH